VNYSTKLVLLTLVTIALLFFTCRFAISDFLYPDHEVIKLKPWRPMARMFFGAVMVPIIMIFARWFRASLSRNRNGR
jgi:hypothetical protein